MRYESAMGRFLVCPLISLVNGRLWIIHTKAAKLFPELLNIPVVYFDTGLEYPEVKQFVKSDNNIIIRRPEINFFQYILKYGYPIISKEISQCICEARVCP